MTFRKALFEVAQQMVQDGKITRLDLLRLRLRLIMPSLAAEVEEAATDEVIAQGLAANRQIDWDKLREFLEWFIPFLLELIGKFDVE